MKNLKLLLNLAFLIMFTLILSSCPGLEEDEVVTPEDELIVIEHEGPLGFTEWNSLLTRINTEGRFVTLDLSRAQLSEDPLVDRGGLIEYELFYSNDVSLGHFIAFDPFPETITEGKRFIVSITLPEAATIIKPAVSEADEPTTPIVVAKDSSAFRHFENLHTVIGEEIQVIGNYAFIGRTTLRKVDFPRLGMDHIPPLTPELYDVGHFAFSGCTSLTTVNLGRAKAIGRYAFENSGLVKIDDNFPDDLEVISQGAFRNSRNLTSVDFRNVQEIGESAFENSPRLRTARFRTSEPVNFEDSVFRGTSLEILNVEGAASVTLGENALADIEAHLDIHLSDDAVTAWSLSPPPFLGGRDATIKSVNIEVPASTDALVVAISIQDLHDHIEVSVNGVLVPRP